MLEISEHSNVVCGRFEPPRITEEGTLWRSVDQPIPGRKLILSKKPHALLPREPRRTRVLAKGWRRVCGNYARGLKTGSIIVIQGSGRSWHFAVTMCGALLGNLKRRKQVLIDSQQSYTNGSGSLKEKTASLRHPLSDLSH